MLVLQDEERGNIPESFVENTDRVIGFSLVFLGKKGQAIRKMEIRNINFQDVIRHLQYGDSVIITPKFLRTSEMHSKKQEQVPWYFPHV